MEKDKSRSVITVGMLVCSILILSALFIGCEKHNTQARLLSAAQLGCLHPFKYVYYTHDPTIPPHDSTVVRFDWCEPLPPSSTTSSPVAQKCPEDPAMTSPDSVKCALCGKKW